MDAVSDPERQTRNAERTRAAVLSAAAHAFTEKGTGVSLASIAKDAGVSKGGLLHHFPTREALIVALVDDANRRFRATVQSHLDLSENQPGKMLRAYVRALCSGAEETVEYFTSAPSWVGVYDIPEVAELSRADELWWTEQFAIDGLAQDRIFLVRRAAEGLAAAMAYGGRPADEVAAQRELLLSLTLGGHLSA
ncbi:TetR/AcrR family transcriptional regulator [Nocardia flavorosea]|uniref:TetR/AcrR family transcriptional regulator n=1 Tax=Nocardia flavorosea TaxID=53429 RepID=A0A846YIV9_9NOCA|nr:TetR/AcrR family transcriptional regulator [Nocardia flavorosea]NKY59556.1 TetR/AcrR family transcriptional regulator [Nocardia flavorosea]